MYHKRIRQPPTQYALKVTPIVYGIRILSNYKWHENKNKKTIESSICIDKHKTIPHTNCNLTKNVLSVFFLCVACLNCKCNVSNEFEIDGFLENNWTIWLENQFRQKYLYRVSVQAVYKERKKKKPNVYRMNILFRRNKSEYGTLFTLTFHIHFYGPWISNWY